MHTKLIVLVHFLFCVHMLLHSLHLYVILCVEESSWRKCNSSPNNLRAEQNVLRYDRVNFLHRQLESDVSSLLFITSDARSCC